MYVGNTPSTGMKYGVPVVGLAEGVSCKTRKLSKVSTELSFKDGNRKVGVETVDHMKLEWCP
jgi:hypothetical protein